MVFNATFNSILVITWHSQVTNTLFPQNFVPNTPAMSGIRSHNFSGVRL